MAEITAAMIKELRDRSGVGMAKCKSALTEAGGDIEQAIEALRKSGAASAVKKEGRETKEGLIGYAETAEVLGLVEVNAETDFVVNNDRFKDFLNNIAKEVAEKAPSSLEDFIKGQYSQDTSLTIDDYRAALVQTIGENIQIRRIKIFSKGNKHSVGVYKHLGGKIVSVVELSGAGNEEAFAKDIAMHVAAASPEYLSPEAVPEAIVEQERDIARSQMAGKPEHIMDKIIDGKLNAFYDDHCLMRQKYIKDDSMNIADLLAKKGKELSISGFTRWRVGQK